MYDIHDIQIKKDKIEVKFLDNSIERLKVGIIDSGIDLNNPFSKDIQLKVIPMRMITLLNVTQIIPTVIHMVLK